MELSRGEWSENGRTCANAEWIICLTLLLNAHENNNLVNRILGDPPHNLLAYGTKPQHKKR